MHKLHTIIILLFVFSSFSLAQDKEAIKEYNAGLQYYNMSNYASAIPFFENAVKKDATFVNAFRVLISCYEQQNNLAKVADLYSKVIDLSPSDKTLCYNLALTYIDLKDYNKCILYLKKAISIDATYSKASDKLNEVQEYLKKQHQKNNESEYQSVEIDKGDLEKQIYNEALQFYKNEKYGSCVEKLEEYDGDVLMADFYYLKAIALQHEGERDQAIESYELALEVDDRHFNSNLNLGRIYYNDRNFREAVNLLETAYERRKNDMSLLLSLCKALYYSKEYKNAIPQFETYLERNSKDGEVWLLLGKCYSNINQSKNASNAFEMAKKYGSNNDEISDDIQNSVAKYGKKASEYTKNGNYEEAINVLEQAIEEHSEEASLHFNLGLNYLEVGNYKKARDEFKKTIDLDAAHAKAYQALGLIYYEREEYSEAAAYYQATVDAGKQDEYVYYKLGSCYFKLKRMEDAIDSYRKAIELNSKVKQFYFSFGLALLSAKENLKSIDAFQTALNLDPNYLDAQYHICVNYIETNEYEKCIKEGEKILKKDSQYAKAYLVIGHANKRMGNYVLAEQYQAKAISLDPTLR